MPVILLIDPDAARRQALGQALKAGPFDVVGVGQFGEAADAVEKQPVGMVVCAAAPAPADALRFCRDLKLKRAALRLVVYDQHEDEALRLRFLERGADRFLAGGRMDEELRTTVEAIVHQDAARPVPADKQMFFKLKAGELGNVLQFLNFSTRTGRLELVFTPASAGLAVCLFEQGQIVHAEFGELTGIEAVATMFLAGEAEAHFFEAAEVARHDLKAPLAQLLLEATVLGDELKEAESVVADLDQVLVRVAADCPAGAEPDADKCWAGADGVTSLADLFADQGLSLARGRRAVKKLLDAGAVKLAARGQGGLSGEARLDRLLARVRQRLQTLAEPQEAERLLLHLETLARRRERHDDYQTAAAADFPLGVRVVYAVCHRGCGAHALMVQGSALRCARCGGELQPKAHADYAFKSM